MLYIAIENAPARKDEQSLDDYLDPTKDGVAKYLKAVMDIMSDFNDLTTDQRIKPPYLANPLIYVTIEAVGTYNKQNGTKIISLEEKLLALLPVSKTEEVAKPKEPEPKETIAEVKQQPTAIAVKSSEPEASSPPTRAETVVMRFKKAINAFIAIRENNIARRVIAPTIDSQWKIIEKTGRMIRAFTLCREKGKC